MPPPDDEQKQAHPAQAERGLVEKRFPASPFALPYGVLIVRRTPTGKIVVQKPPGHEGQTGHWRNGQNRSDIFHQLTQPRGFGMRKRMMQTENQIRNPSGDTKQTGQANPAQQPKSGAAALAQHQQNPQKAQHNDASKL